MAMEQHLITLHPDHRQQPERDVSQHELLKPQKSDTAPPQGHACTNNATPTNHFQTFPQVSPQGDSPFR